jgi:hypothetical protein
VLFLLLVCAVAIGFYRGWFTLSNSRPNAGSNKVDVNLTVDGDKIQEDAESVKKKSTELTDKVTKSAKEPREQESPNR